MIAFCTYPSMHDALGVKVYSMYVSQGSNDMGLTCSAQMSHPFPPIGPLTKAFSSLKALENFLTNLLLGRRHSTALKNDDGHRLRYPHLFT